MVITHTFQLTNYHWLVSTTAYTPEVPARRGRGDRARKRVPASVTIDPMVTRVDRKTQEHVPRAFNVFKQEFADELCGGDLDEAQKLIEIDLASANHRASDDYKIKMRRAHRRIAGRQLSRARSGNRNEGRGRGRNG